MRNDPIVRQIDSAIDAHAEWKRKLYNSIDTGIAHISAATACCDDKCALGKWLHGPQFDEATRRGDDFRAVVNLHALFHKTAGSVLAYVERGNVSAAQFIMDGEYDFRSEDLVLALVEWRAKHVDPSAPLFATSARPGPDRDAHHHPCEECESLILRPAC